MGLIQNIIYSQIMIKQERCQDDEIRTVQAKKYDKVVLSSPQKCLMLLNRDCAIFQHQEQIEQDIPDCLIWKRQQASSILMQQQQVQVKIQQSFQEQLSRNHQIFDKISFMMKILIKTDWQKGNLKFDDIRNRIGRFSQLKAEEINDIGQLDKRSTILIHYIRYTLNHHKGFFSPLLAAQIDQFEKDMKKKAKIEEKIGFGVLKTEDKIHFVPQFAKGQQQDPSSNRNLQAKQEYFVDQASINQQQAIQ